MSDENAALVARLKKAVADNDFTQLDGLVTELGWNNEIAQQKDAQRQAVVEAEEASKWGIPVEQYRAHMASLAQHQAAMRGEGPMPAQAPQPPQGWVPPHLQPTNQWAGGYQQNQAAPPAPPSQAAGGVQPVQAAFMKSVSAMEQKLQKKIEEQSKYIDELKKHKEEQAKAVQQEEYAEIFKKRYEGIKDKLEGLKYTDESHTLGTAMQIFADKFKAGEKDLTPEKVLIELNNQHAASLNKTFEERFGSKERNIPIYKEEPVKTLTDETTQAGATVASDGKDQPKEQVGLDGEVKKPEVETIEYSGDDRSDPEISSSSILERPEVKQKIDAIIKADQGYSQPLGEETEIGSVEADSIVRQ